MKKIIMAAAVVAAASNIVNAQQDWAAHNRYAADNAALSKAPDVVFMGNSITDCWDDSHPEFFTDNNFANRGISGQVTTQMLGRFYADVIALHPKTVVILGGVNDIAGNQGFIELDNIAQNVFSMAELARQHGIRPIIASNLPCGAIPWNTGVTGVAEKIIAVNKMLRDYAEANDITYVDYYSALTTPEGALDTKYTNDGVHPTQAGYDIMEPMILSAIRSDEPDVELKVVNAGSVKKTQNHVTGQPVYIADGEIVNDINSLDHDTIASMRVLNGETVKNGVVIITLKK